MNFLSDPIENLNELFLEKGFFCTYWIAYSGGLDSQVLLFLCNLIKKNLPLKLKVIHIHHGLSPYADDWAAFCQNQCNQMSLDYLEKKIQLTIRKGESIEEKARNKRYEQFAHCLQADDILLTAHHQDDQAETVLLQLFRGAGLEGLAAMPSFKPFSKGWHARPFLRVTRSQLHDLALTHQLTWLRDESNENISFSRNFIRHHILPLLKKRWPTVNETITRSASHCAEAMSLLNDYVIKSYSNTVGSQPNTLSIYKLLNYSTIEQKKILRHWIKSQNYLVPNTKRLKDIQKSLLLAGKDSNPHVAWSTVGIRRFQDDLYLVPKFLIPEFSFKWNFNDPLTLPAVGTLITNPVLGGLQEDLGELTVKFRQGGEKIFCGKFNRTLKNLFQEWKVPTWKRSAIPIIWLEAEIVTVVGYFMNPKFQVASHQTGKEIKLLPCT
jgi:tRNA(Ile)-lysidine synthase